MKVKYLITISICLLLIFCKGKEDANETSEEELKQEKLKEKLKR